jgi:hypothetical protein
MQPAPPQPAWAPPASSAVPAGGDVWAPLPVAQPLVPPPSAPPRRVPPPYRPPSGLLPPVAPPAASAPLSAFADADALTASMARLGASAPPPPPSAASDAGGLANATGEYNCFLNAIVQALYHVRCFRRHLLDATVPPASTPGLEHIAPSLAVVCSLQALCQALHDGADLARDAGAAGAVAPTALRVALAALPGAGGEGGLHAMADAAEVLGAMYDAFQVVSAAGAASRGGVVPAPQRTRIGRMFGLHVHEAVRCGVCAAVTHQLQYTAFFHIVHAAALRAARGAVGPGAPFDGVLAHLLCGDTKRCDKDAGGCGAAAPIAHALAQPPEVFTLSLAWDTAQAAEEEVASTMRALGVQLQPERVFTPERRRAAPPYELRALACFYGSHYVSFARTDEPEADPFGVQGAPPEPEWTRFDDASVSRVGRWADVCAACAKGHLQPTVLFYEQPAAGAF